MAELAVQNLSVGGSITPAENVAESGGDSFPNPRSDVFLHVRNQDESTHTLTIPAQRTSRPAEGGFPPTDVDDIVVAVPTNESRLIGPFPSAYNNSSGHVSITYDDATSVLVSPVRFPG